MLHIQVLGDCSERHLIHKVGESLLLPRTHQSSYTDMHLSSEGKKCDPRASNIQGCILRFCVDFSLCFSVQLSTITFLGNFCCVFNKNAQTVKICWSRRVNEPKRNTTIPNDSRKKRILQEQIALLPRNVSIFQLASSCVGLTYC